MTDQHGLFVELNSTDTGTDPQEARLALGGLIGRDPSGNVAKGVLIDGMGSVVTGTGAMSYSIRPCNIVTKLSDANGPVITRNRTAQTVTTTSAPGSNSRIDAVYALQRHVAGDGGSGDLNDIIFGVVQGSVSATPTAPLDSALPAGATRLANVRVTSGATQTSGLTYTRGHEWVPANGGIVPESASRGRVYNGANSGVVGLGETGWLTPTAGPFVNLSPSWHAAGTRYKRAGLHVTLTTAFAVTGTKPQWSTAFSIPADLAPEVPMIIPIMDATLVTTFRYWATLHPDGNVIISASEINGENRYGGAITWPIKA